MFRNLSLILSFSILGLFACQQAEKKQAEITAEARMASVEMKVDGMVCAMGCAKFIENKVAEEAGVNSSKVDFESETAYFTYDANQWTAEELEQFINDIHDGQYKATIVAQQEVEEEKKEEDLQDEAEDEEEDKDADVAQVVSEVQNISFPELLTYFINRL